MSNTATAIPLDIADTAAQELQRMLLPVCERVAVAGSVRRRMPVCGDIELVAVPRLELRPVPNSLLPQEVDILAEWCEIIRKGDHHRLRRPVPRTLDDGTKARQPPWGDRYKKLALRCAHRWCLVDLWITSPERFGSILALRTGNKDFSRLLVTRRDEGGAMPLNVRQQDGGLQTATQVADGVVWQPLPTWEESDFFFALGLPVLDPMQRSEQGFTRLLAERAARSAASV